MKYLLSSFCIAVLLLAGCQGNDKDNNKTDDALPEDSTVVENVDSVLTPQLISTFNNQPFAAYARTKAVGFDWRKFRMTNTWSEDSATKGMAYTPNKPFMAAYGALVKYSPDSTAFVDLDSYNTDVKKDAAGRWTATELGPDTEISLVDLQANKKKRLLFLGPGSSVEDACWGDNANLFLFGLQENVSGKGQSAAVWRYHVPTKTFYLYEWPDTSANRLAGFKQLRLQQVLRP